MMRLLNPVFSEKFFRNKFFLSENRKMLKKCLRNNHSHVLYKKLYAHKTNQYNFPLINLISPDEFKKWCHITCCICNREDELVLISFLQAIKERCWNRNLEIYPVMTGNDNSGWNAFLRVFGDCTQLLCK